MSPSRAVLNSRDHSQTQGCVWFVWFGGFLKTQDGISIRLSIGTCGDTFTWRMSWFKSFSGGRPCMGAALREKREKVTQAAANEE